MRVDIPDLLETAKLAVIAAGKEILEIYHTGHFSITIKSNSTPLTKADQCAHQVIIDHLRRTSLPVLSEEGIKISYNERKLWEYFWLIDPLDGTTEFIHKNNEFTINIALIHGNIPIAGVVYVPCTDTLYYGSKETGVYKREQEKQILLLPLQERTRLNELLQKEGITAIASRSHLSSDTKLFINQFKNASTILMGSSLKFMLLLEGRAAIYPGFGTTMEWDTAAAHAMLNATNRGVYQINMKSELFYNKPDLKNSSFIAF